MSKGSKQTFIQEDIKMAKQAHEKRHNIPFLMESVNQNCSELPLQTHQGASNHRNCQYGEIGIVILCWRGHKKVIVVLRNAEILLLKVECKITIGSSTSTHRQNICFIYICVCIYLIFICIYITYIHIPVFQQKYVHNSIKYRKVWRTQQPSVSK